MAEVKTYGLKTLKHAAVEADGSFPAVLTELCRTYRDSVEFTEADPTTTEEFCDQEDDAIFQIVEKGAKEISFSTFDYSPEVLQKVKGGTIVDNTWSEPTITPEIHMAIEIETNTGVKFQFPKCRVIAQFNSRFQKRGLTLLDVTLRPLSPAPGVPAVAIVKPED